MPLLFTASVRQEQVLLQGSQSKTERPHPRLYAAQAGSESYRKGGSMKALTRKEAQKELEFLMSLEKLARVLDEPKKQPVKAKTKAAAA